MWQSLSIYLVQSWKIDLRAIWTTFLLSQYIRIGPEREIPVYVCNQCVILLFGQSQDINKLMVIRVIDRSKTELWSITPKLDRAPVEARSTKNDTQGPMMLHFEFQVNQSSYVQVMDGSIFVKNGFISILSYRSPWHLV